MGKVREKKGEDDERKGEGQGGEGDDFRETFLKFCLVLLS